MLEGLVFNVWDELVLDVFWERMARSRCGRCGLVIGAWC